MHIFPTVAFRRRFHKVQAVLPALWAWTTSSCSMMQNDIQLSTETKDVTIEDTAKKYEAWGWKVIKIDGNDADAIRGALNEAKAEAERPTLIIGHTVMGKGARKADGSSYEANCATHALLWAVMLM